MPAIGGGAAVGGSAARGGGAGRAAVACSVRQQREEAAGRLPRHFAGPGGSSGALQGLQQRQARPPPNAAQPTGSVALKPTCGLSTAIGRPAQAAPGLERSRLGGSRRETGPQGSYNTLQEHNGERLACLKAQTASLPRQRMAKPAAPSRVLQREKRAAAGCGRARSIRPPPPLPLACSWPAGLVAAKLRFVGAGRRYAKACGQPAAALPRLPRTVRRRLPTAELQGLCECRCGLPRRG